MAMIYGLNYLGSSFVAPTWAYAPGMQTGGLQGRLCLLGRKEERVGGGVAGASLCGGGAVTPVGEGLPCLLWLGIGGQFGASPGTLCKGGWKEEWL